MENIQNRLVVPMGCGDGSPSTVVRSLHRAIVAALATLHRDSHGATRFAGGPLLFLVLSLEGRFFLILGTLRNDFIPLEDADHVRVKPGTESSRFRDLHIEFTLLRGNGRTRLRRAGGLGRKCLIEFAGDFICGCRVVVVHFIRTGSHRFRGMRRGGRWRLLLRLRAFIRHGPWSERRGILHDRKVGHIAS